MARESLVAGVDLGGTKINAAVVDPKGVILAQDRVKTEAAQGFDAVSQRLSTLVRGVCQEIGIETSALDAVCVGVPGSVDDGSGQVHRAPNLDWTDAPLGPRLSDSLGTRVFLDNDVRVAALGEYAYGAGRGASTLVGIFVGTGIGGAVLEGGELRLGSRGAAGEIGHMVIVPGGPRCGCGQRGCVEAISSRTAMERTLHELAKEGRKSRVFKILDREGRERLTSSVIVKALREGDEVMAEVLRGAQKNLGLLVGSIVNLLDPDVVVIGGGIAERMGDEFVAPIRKVAHRRFLLQRDREKVRIVPAELADRSAPLGAAVLARRKLASPAPALVAAK
jgi:glucokinase